MCLNKVISLSLSLSFHCHYTTADGYPRVKSGS